MALTDRLYELTRTFPKSEMYGLTSQIRRAAVSVPSNIAEGYGRGSKAGFASSAKMSRGELYELRTQIEVAFRQKILEPVTNAELRADMIQFRLKLAAFIRSLERPSEPPTANR